MAPKFDITPEKEASNLQWLYRQFFARTPLLTKEDANLTGKTAIVTGSNTGLGLETARQLLDLGLSKIILAVRNVTKGKTASKSLSLGRDPTSCEIDVWSLDMTSYDSINEFVDRVKTLERLDIVVLNAGLFNVTENFIPTTGFEEDIQVNYISSALLASLLLPILKEKSGQLPSRLVIVSSDTAAWVKFKERSSKSILDSFKQKEKKWDMAERYGTSKLLGQLFLTELAQQVPVSAVTIDSVNPGLCHGSELARGAKGQGLLGIVVNLGIRIIGKQLEVGARSIVHAAVSFGEEVHGQYVEDGKIRPMAAIIYKPEGEQLAKRLWEETMAELSFANVEETIQGLKH